MPPVPNATEELSVPVNVNVLFTLKVLLLAIVNVPETVWEIANPLIDVADAIPNVGAVNTGEVNVLFVNVWASPSVTNLCETDPSYVLQYCPDSYHCNAEYDVTNPKLLVALLNWIPPSVPVRFNPFLNSNCASAIINVCDSTVVVDPVTFKSPLIVINDPSSSIIELTTCVFAVSHFKILLPVKLSAFFNSKFVEFNTMPLLAVNEAPVSVLTEEIVIVFPFCDIVVAPLATNVISPDWYIPDVVPLNLVTVSM